MRSIHFFKSFFLQQQNLEKMPKRFACKTCGLAYAHASSLCRHEQVKHQQQPSEEETSPPKKRCLEKVFSTRQEKKSLYHLTVSFLFFLELTE